MNENSMTKIGLRIQKLREDAGLTQAQLAKILNVRREVVAKWETGLQDLKTTYTIKLADFFNITCDELLRGIEAKNVALNNEIGLENEYIETLKLAVKERRKNKNEYEHTVIDAINAIFYGITRNINIINCIINILDFDLDLAEMSEDEGVIKEAEEINEKLEGKGIFLRYSQYITLLEQMAKDFFSKVVEDIVNHYANSSPMDNYISNGNFFADNLKKEIFDTIWYNKANYLYKKLKEASDNADNNPEEE